jgi:ADP-ribose pyrophosphatase YjhB (NUDIX family)
MRAGETCTQAVERVLHEETGLKGRVLPFSTSRPELFVVQWPQGRPALLSVVYHAEAEGDILQGRSAFCDQWEWLTVTEIIQRLAQKKHSKENAKTFWMPIQDLYRVKDHLGFVIREDLWAIDLCTGFWR